MTALIRSLPKDLRRPLVPVPEVATAALAAMKPRSEPLLGALARELERLRGVRIPADAWALDRLPPHLRMTFRVEDERGALVAEGNDLDALREQVRPRLREALAVAAAPLEHHGLQAWTIGPLPKVVALPGTGQAVRGYPALVDEGETVGVRVLETPAAQRDGDAAGHAQAAGAERALADPARRGPAVERRTSSRSRAAPHGSLRAVLEDATVAALDALTAEAGGPAWDADGLRAAARARRRAPGRPDRGGGRRRRGDPRRRACRGAAARGAARRRRRSRRPARTSSASSPGWSRPGS